MPERKEVRAFITLAQGEHAKRPRLIGLDADLRVTSGLDTDDGAQLIGFVQPGTYEVSVFARQGVDSPELTIGLHPVFSNGGGFFNWILAVEKIEKLP